MEIYNYKYFLLESYLLTSQFLEDILHSMNDRVAKNFIQLIQSDVVTKYNITY